ncbi:MAG: ATP-binding cassette domain-containing protein [Hyphomicrobiales bacterium]
MSFGRLKDALGGKRSGQGAGGDGPGLAIGDALGRIERRPPGGHLVSDIGRVADEWHGRPASNEPRPAAGDVPTPEALMAAADERDVSVSYEQRSLSSLVATDFPCVVLLENGTSQLLVGRAGPDSFICDVEGRRYTVGIGDIEAVYAGTVFFIRPPAPVAGMSTSGLGAPAAPAAEPAGGAAEAGMDLVREVFQKAMQTQRRLMSQLLLSAYLSNLLMVALPLFTMSVYDRVIPHLAMETLWALSLGVFIALGLDFAIRWVRLKLSDAIGLSTALSLQGQLYRRLLQMRMGEAPRTAGGVAATFREFEGICQIVPQLFVGVAADVPFFFFLMLLLYSIGGPVVLAPLAGVIMLAGVHYAGHVKTAATTPEAARLTRQQANQVMETVAALEAVKATTSEDRLLRQWERLSDEASYSGHRGRLWTAFSGQAALVVTQVVIVLVMMIGVYRIGAGEMTVGALAASTLIVGRAVSPMGQFVNLLFRLGHLMRGADGIAELRRARTEVGGDAHRPTARDLAGGVEAINVTFAYPGEPKATLTGINLVIRPGEKVALIGRIGSGKSTLLRLILRFHEASEGTLLIDGNDIRQFSPRVLRRQIGYLRQDPVLFDDTLRANITRGLDAVDEAAFERAVAISGVREIAAKHPRGYALRVGPRGERLSGGERQAVALARTLLAEPRIVVLDEPTASMDNSLEARIVRELKAFAEGRTVIVATHRAPILDLVDRIVWIEGGRVLADGPKAEVLKRLGGAAA